MHLNIFPTLWLIFCFHQQKIQKMSHFSHFNNHNTGSKHDKPHCSHVIFELYLLVYLILCLKTFKIQFHGLLPLHYVLVSKIYISMQKLTTSGLLTWISLFYRKVADFWYITCFVANLIPIVPQSQVLIKVFFKNSDWQWKKLKRKKKIQILQEWMTALVIKHKKPKYCTTTSQSKT